MRRLGAPIAGVRRRRRPRRSASRWRAAPQAAAVVDRRPSRAARSVAVPPTPDRVGRSRSRWRCVVVIARAPASHGGGHRRRRGAADTVVHDAHPVEAGRRRAGRRDAGPDEPPPPLVADSRPPRRRWRRRRRRDAGAANVGDAGRRAALPRKERTLPAEVADRARRGRAALATGDSDGALHLARHTLTVQKIARARSRSSRAPTARAATSATPRPHFTRSRRRSRARAQVRARRRTSISSDAALAVACLLAARRRAGAAAARYNEPAAAGAALAAGRAHRGAGRARSRAQQRRETPRPDARLERGRARTLARHSPRRRARRRTSWCRRALWLHGMVEPPPHLIVATIGGRAAKRTMLARARRAAARGARQGRYRRVGVGGRRRRRRARACWWRCRSRALDARAGAARAAAGGRAPLRGRLLAGFQRPEAFVTAPDGQVDAACCVGGDATQLRRARSAAAAEGALPGRDHRRRSLRRDGARQLPRLVRRGARPRRWRHRRAARRRDGGHRRRRRPRRIAGAGWSTPIARAPGCRRSTADARLRRRGARALGRHARARLRRARLADDRLGRRSRASAPASTPC